jgi:hypothetical protein
MSGRYRVIHSERWGWRFIVRAPNGGAIGFFDTKEEAFEMRARLEAKEKLCPACGKEK